MLGQIRFAVRAGVSVLGVRPRAGEKSPRMKAVGGESGPFPGSASSFWEGQGDAGGDDAFGQSAGEDWWGSWPPDAEEPSRGEEAEEGFVGGHNKVRESTKPRWRGAPSCMPLCQIPELAAETFGVFRQTSDQLKAPLAELHECNSAYPIHAELRARNSVTAVGLDKAYLRLPYSALSAG